MLWANSQPAKCVRQYILHARCAVEQLLKSNFHNHFHRDVFLFGCVFTPDMGWDWCEREERGRNLGGQVVVSFAFSVPFPVRSDRVRKSNHCQWWCSIQPLTTKCKPWANRTNTQKSCDSGSAGKHVPKYRAPGIRVWRTRAFRSHFLSVGRAFSHHGYGARGPRKNPFMQIEFSTYRGKELALRSPTVQCNVKDVVFLPLRSRFLSFHWMELIQ